ncbi:hypothetical protein NDU88_002612 [Pleurodeles waltl]|uniref:Uncharacterized protein n=1 Tax=Pleurodeles waltl TaxID=8319 RepID=A0AAV7SDE8_PLEWA|nr:hypothetical protein NDU88_002612 [Pleurodeles waltl]
MGAPDVPQFVGCGGKRVSQGGSFYTRGPGLLPRRGPRLCPRLTSIQFGRARVPRWILQLSHIADPLCLG